MFYTEADPLRYGSSVGPLLPFCEECTVNRQAVSDMLLMGNLWGDHTLVEEVRSLRPATVLDADDDGRRIERYWKPEYAESQPGEEYLAELVDRYKQAVRRAAGTLPSTAGIWLSGGLDSRTTTSALVRTLQTNGFEELRAYSYDANPPTNANPEIASDVATTLGIGHEEVPLTAATVGTNVDEIVEATDGMLNWTTAANLSATYEMESPPPVLMEGMQGALVGDHLYRHHLSDANSAVASQLASEGSARPETVRSLVTEPVDPLGTFREEAARSPESTIRGRVLDVHFQNYYSRLAMPSNRLMRGSVGTRVIHADGEYLEWCAKLPSRYRKGAFRLNGLLERGVPYEPTRAKLALVRRIDPELARITYERSKLKPTWPYHAHVAGFVGNVLINRLQSKPTYGGGQLADFWIRNTETELHERVRGLIDDACSRALFDADAVRDVFVDHMDGANNALMLSRITTLEHWLQKHVD
jgi:asparagine synthase (glutamine-hydrolysing)